MNYGLYLSASGVLTNLYRQDVFANNLSNSQTAGFKPHVPAIRQREPEAVEDQLGPEVSQQLLEKLGGGVLAGPQWTSFAPSPVEVTGQPMDVAIREPNQFFAVAEGGQNGSEGVQLTRDGRFSLSSDGELVTAAGYRVLDVRDQPIRLPAGAEVRIQADGRVLANGAEVARVQVARVAQPRHLEKLAGGRFRMPDPDQRQMIDQPRLEIGAVETSGVDPIRTLLQLTAATKAATGNAKMIQYHDSLMDRAVNSLGRVA
ncbi:MAG: flagellar hook-basal body protein [Phycisphaeraceae bacterium]